MNKKQRVQFILDTLENLYPKTPIPLDHTDAYTLLISVLLSAQCTDIRVNQITPKLFSLAKTPEDMLKLRIEEIREIIKPCGLSPAKSKGIWGLSKMIMDLHGGSVPQSFEALEAMPSVGHKTASVVMSQAFGVPAFPVDTHIHRLAYRWKLSAARTVVETERDLKRLFSPGIWNKLHLQIIFFGREFCQARGHTMETCPICSIIGCREKKK